MGDFEAPEYYELQQVTRFYQAEGVIYVIPNVPVRDGVIHFEDIIWDTAVRLDTDDLETQEQWKNAYISPGPTECTPYGVNVVTYFHVGDEGPGKFVPYG